MADVKGPEAQKYEALVKSKQCARIATDVWMVAHGAPLTKRTLVDRWMAGAQADFLTREHLLAARRQVAIDHHPDKGGSAAVMAIANAAIDQTIKELDRLTQIEESAYQARRSACLTHGE